MPIVQLPDRALIEITGPEAEHFLQNIVTTDLDTLGQNELRAGALLSPQGKILFDFLVSRLPGGGLRLDVRAGTAADFVRRLTLYKLRAKADFSVQEQALVAVAWENDSGGSESDSTGGYADSRFPADVKLFRYYGSAISDAPESAWHALRIAYGIAESGLDYELGDAFPHDVLLDQTNGVGFKKGCYIGQEVVSRMHHRGTARRRVLIASASHDLTAGADITANGRTVGALGSVSGSQGLAIARIDRVKDAVDAGTPLLAGEIPITLSIPGWARFTFPETAGGDAD